MFKTFYKMYFTTAGKLKKKVCFQQNIFNIKTVNILESLKQSRVLFGLILYFQALSLFEPTKNYAV